MATYAVYGKTCKIKINIPKTVDANTKKVLTEIAKNCLETKNQKIASDIVKDVLSRTGTLISSLKKSNVHSAPLEKSIREFLGFYLNHGFQFGKDLVPPEASEESDESENEEPEGEEQESANVYDLLKEQYNYKKVMSKIKGKSKEIGTIMFYCMDITRLAFEAGLLLGLYLSEEKIEQYYSVFGKEAAYIG